MTISFTQDEKTHAQGVVDQLLRERRFFISTEKEFKYHFPEKIFGASLDLQSTLIESYNQIRDEAEKKILTAEKELGFALPQVPKNRQISQCNKYAGGFDIKSVFPLSFFLQDNILEPDKIFTHLLEIGMNGKSSDDISPNEMENINQNASQIEEKILHQWKIIQNHENFSKLSVVLLKSRFSLDGNSGRDDLSEGKLDLIEKSPELLGYLLYEKSKKTRFVGHDYILLNTSKKSHVVISHWNRKEPSIFYSFNTGYTCRTHFASIF